MSVGREYKRKLQSVRDADAQHEKDMTEICALGGKTPREVRRMQDDCLEAFVTKWGAVWRQSFIERGGSS